jgi:hypothetical protein
MIGLILPLIWIGLLVRFTNLIPLRISYIDLWREHERMMHLIDQGQKSVRSATGDSLADTFEYMSGAMRAYLGALEFVLLLGILPAMAIWFAMVLRTSLSQNSKTVTAVVKDMA